MAYIVSSLQTTAGSGATTYTVNFPSGVLANDLLVVLLTQDGSTESLGVGTSGFTALGTQVEAGGSAGTSGLPFFKIAAGGETSASFACSTAAIIGTAILVRDAHATTPFGSVVDGTDYKRVEWNSANYADSPNGASALTTAVDECLLLYAFCSDGANVYMRCKTSEAIELDKYQGASSSHIIGFNQQQTAGVAPTVRMYHNTAVEGGNAWVLAVRNKTGGALQPIPRMTSTELKWYGSWAAQHDSVTWQAPSNFSVITAGAFVNGTKYTIVSVGTTDFTLIGAASNTVGVQFTATGAGTGTGTAGEAINAIFTSNTAPTVDNTNFWTATGATYGANTRLTSTESTAGAWVGGTHAISSTDMTGKIFSFEGERGVTPISITSGSEGWIIGFSDGTNWVAYQIVSKAKGWATSPERSFIALGNATVYASSGSINWAAITRIAYFVHRIGSTTGAAVFSIKNAILLDSVALTGGGASRPATFLDLQGYINSWNMYQVALLQASSQVLVRTTVQLGDGTNATYFDGSAQAFEFPQAWSASSVANWQMNWNALSNQTALSVLAKSGDTINLAAGVAATDTEQNLTINASSSTSATYSFAQSFVGWRDPIDNAGLSWVGATFKQCGTVTIAGGGDLTNCTIAKTSSANAALSITANGSTLDGCTIDGTGAAYALELGTAVTAITLTDCTITAGSTDKVHVLATTGTVTITISGTTSLAAGDVTSAGATVVIAAPVEYQSVTLSNYVTGSRIQIYDTTNGVELYNDIPAAAPQTLWTDSVAASTSGARDIRVRVAYVSGTTAKSFIEAAIGTVAASGSGIALSYRVNQTDDDTYNSNAVDGSAVTGITIVEGSTDRVQIAIAGGSVSWAQIYAYQCWWLFDSVGITDDGAFIEAPDTANYILTGFKIKNTHASIPLLITGGYGVDSTGSVSALYDTTGTSIFPAPAHVVPYATGSGVTPSDITDIASASATAAATAVWGDSKALTVPKFLGLK